MNALHKKLQYGAALLFVFSMGFFLSYAQKQQQADAQDQSKLEILKAKIGAATDTVKEGATAAGEFAERKAQDFKNLFNNSSKNVVDKTKADEESARQEGVRQVARAIDQQDEAAFTKAHMGMVVEDYLTKGGGVNLSPEQKAAARNDPVAFKLKLEDEADMNRRVNEYFKTEAGAKLSDQEKNAIRQNPEKFLTGYQKFLDDFRAQQQKDAAKLSNDKSTLSSTVKKATLDFVESVKQALPSKQKQTQAEVDKQELLDAKRVADQAKKPEEKDTAVFGVQAERVEKSPTKSSLQKIQDFFKPKELTPDEIKKKQQAKEQEVAAKLQAWQARRQQVLEKKAQAGDSKARAILRGQKIAQDKNDEFAKQQQAINKAAEQDSAKAATLLPEQSVKKEETIWLGQELRPSVEKNEEPPLWLGQDLRPSVEKPVEKKVPDLWLGD